jgi:hypothetical protein
LIGALEDVNEQSVDAMVRIDELEAQQREQQYQGRPSARLVSIHLGETIDEPVPLLQEIEEGRRAHTRLAQTRAAFQAEIAVMQGAVAEADRAVRQAVNEIIKSSPELVALVEAYDKARGVVEDLRDCLLAVGVIALPDKFANWAVVNREVTAPAEPRLTWPPIVRQPEPLLKV